jgi:hypothetical protein
MYSLLQLLLSDSEWKRGKFAFNISTIIREFFSLFEAFMWQKEIVSNENEVTGYERLKNLENSKRKSSTPPRECIKKQFRWKDGSIKKKRERERERWEWVTKLEPKIFFFVIKLLQSNIQHQQTEHKSEEGGCRERARERENSSIGGCKYKLCE